MCLGNFGDKLRRVAPWCGGLSDIRTARLDLRPRPIPGPTIALITVRAVHPFLHQILHQRAPDRSQPESSRNADLANASEPAPLTTPDTLLGTY